MTSIDHLLGRIHQTDCLPFMRSLPDKCVDLVLTDPPYGIKRFENVDKETSGCFAKKGTFANAAAWNNGIGGGEVGPQVVRLRVGAEVLRDSQQAHRGGEGAIKAVLTMRN